MCVQVVRWKQEEGRMTENGKPKYFTLMEELKEKIISGRIQQERSCHQRISLQYNIPSAGIRCERHLVFWNRKAI